MTNRNHHTHRGQDLENPPKGFKTGFSNLIWNLRAYGYPINMESVEYVREYLEKQQMEPEEVNYRVVAQWIAQNKPVDADFNNEVPHRQIRFSEY